MVERDRVYADYQSVARQHMGWLEWLWSFLPDRCEMPGCCRRGVRGNENVIDGKIMCDYCHANKMLDENISDDPAPRPAGTS